MEYNVKPRPSFRPVTVTFDEEEELTVLVGMVWQPYSHEDNAPWGLKTKVKIYRILREALEAGRG